MIKDVRTKIATQKTEENTGKTAIRGIFGRDIP
jgi:hypothetical protein